MASAKRKKATPSVGGLVPDLYTVTQTALALGLSPKRIRQLIEEEKLTPYSFGPVTLRQVEVLAMRDSRRASGKTTEAKSDPITLMLAMLEKQTQQQARAIEAITESNRHNLENLTAQVNELKAETERLRRQWWRR